MELYLVAPIFIGLAYLFGSFTSAVVVCRLMGLPDPRTQGSGNPGATNVLRHGGKKAALLTLFLDLFKGLLPVLIARLFSADPWLLSGVALAAFLGHLFPLFFNFRGGKGVATAFGAFLGLAWPVALALLGTWLAVAAIFRYSSLAALSAAALAPIYMAWFSASWIYSGVTLLITALLFWRHRSNITNLRQGKEHKIGARRS
jgi:acyl phosphate:glycerol-3-phosphate acyltransferase